MQIPLQVIFRNVDPSAAVEAKIKEKVEKLERFNGHITSCRVAVEAPHKHHHKGGLYHVRVDLTLPGEEIVVNRSPSQHQAHEDVYVAVRDAFNAVQRKLEDYVRTHMRRREAKHHEVPPHGLVFELFPEQHFGRIRTPEGREIYFHRNSLLNGEFDHLTVGTEVRFDESMGDQGPQASSVRVIGKHHIVG